MIELYDVRDLRKTAHTYHVEPDRPGIMCTSSPYTLLYADSSKYVKPQDVTSLDCRTSRPVYKGTTHTRYPSNSDMCCVRDGDKSLLVTSYSHQGDEESGIYAYNRWVSIHYTAWTLLYPQPHERSLIVMSHKLSSLNETSNRKTINILHSNIFMLIRTGYIQLRIQRPGKGGGDNILVWLGVPRPPDSLLTLNSFEKRY